MAAIAKLLKVASNFGDDLNQDAKPIVVITINELNACRKQQLHDRAKPLVVVAIQQVALAVGRRRFLQHLWDCLNRLHCAPASI